MAQNPAAQSPYHIKKYVPWTITGTGFADIVVFNGTTTDVYEIKPNNQVAIAAGTIQLNGYISALERERRFPNPQTGSQLIGFSAPFDRDPTKTLVVYNSVNGIITYKIIDNNQQRQEQYAKQVIATLGIITLAILAAAIVADDVTVVGVLDDYLLVVVAVAIAALVEWGFGPDDVSAIWNSEEVIL